MKRVLPSSNLEAWRPKEFVGFSWEIPGFPRSSQLHLVRMIPSDSAINCHALLTIIPLRLRRGEDYEIISTEGRDYSGLLNRDPESCDDAASKATNQFAIQLSLSRVYVS